MKDPLFPELPADEAERSEHLASLTDEQLESLLKEHEVAAQAIEEGNESFLADVTPEEELSELERGALQIEQIKAEQKARSDQEQEYLASKEEKLARMKASLSSGEEEAADEAAADEDAAEGEDADEEGNSEAEDEEAAEEESGDAELAAEVDEIEVEDEQATEAKEKQKATSAAAASKLRQVQLRRPPSASAERRGREMGTALIAAAGQVGIRGGQMLDRDTLAQSVMSLAKSVGTPTKEKSGIEQRFLVASAQFPFPDERRLFPGELEANTKKIQAVIPDQIPGLMGLVASGGLCAPLENIYTMPNFASQRRPVRDGLPSFQAERGGVNVPEATTIGDITTAISLITEAADASGGTFATKSCQDLSCPAYTETAVSVIAHCREYGNLNARAWPEKIAHENDLTMAAHARVAERYLLDRIRAQSVPATMAGIGGGGAEMNAFASIVHGIVRAQAAIKRRLRAYDNPSFRAILPDWIGELLAADDTLKQLDTADRARAALTRKLEQYNVNVVYAYDDPTGFTSFAATQTPLATLTPFPVNFMYALYLEGTFIHVDSGSLELGLVRDSTLNSTNDFQFFGETFENVARIGPAQGALWITQDVCANGVYPALGTAPTC